MSDLNAKRLVEWAEENGFTIRRGAVGYGKKLCACALIMTYRLGDRDVKSWGLYDQSHQRKAGLTAEKFMSIEDGFENYPIEKTPNKRYYSLGQNIAKLAGLSVKP